MFLRLSERVESIVGSDFAVDFGESSGAKRELWRAKLGEKQRLRTAIKNASTSNVIENSPIPV